jgi:hypothetical protein
MLPVSLLGGGVILNSRVRIDLEPERRLELLLPD